MDEKDARNWFLLLKIALHNKSTPTLCTMGDLGDNTNLSQQTVSRRLIQLEKDEFLAKSVQGKQQGLIVTDKGYAELREVYGQLKLIFMSSTAKDYIFKALVKSGMGEGKWYVTLPGYREQFSSKLGYEPFPGTLNIFLDDPRDRKQYYEILPSLKVIKIDGFTTPERTYGDVECIPATLYREHETVAVKGHILNIHRTSHKSGTVEFISKQELRSYYQLKDEDKVSLKLVINPDA